MAQHWVIVGPLSCLWGVQDKCFENVTYQWWSVLTHNRPSYSQHRVCIIIWFQNFLWIITDRLLTYTLKLNDWQSCIIIVKSIPILLTSLAHRCRDAGPTLGQSGSTVLCWVDTFQENIILPSRTIKQTRLVNKKVTVIFHFNNVCHILISIYENVMYTCAFTMLETNGLFCWLICYRDQFSCPFFLCRPTFTMKWLDLLSTVY